MGGQDWLDTETKAELQGIPPDFEIGIRMTATPHIGRGGRNATLGVGIAQPKKRGSGRERINIGHQITSKSA